METLLSEKNAYDVFENYFLPHLGWNDLLRFRRICKKSKDIANKYIKENGEQLCPEITIYEASDNKEKTLVHFLQLGFPTTRIYLMNISGVDMFKKNSKQFIEFLGKHGARITHVRVHKLQNHPFGMEKRFYEELPGLKSLVIDMFGSAKSTEAEAKREGASMKSGYPSTFKNLKKVTIGLEQGAISMNVFIVSRSVMDFCIGLEYCGDAYSSGIKIGNLELTFEALKVAFSLVQRYMEESNQNLKFYDFATFHDDQCVQNKCHAFVHAPYFHELNWQSDISVQDPLTFGNLVVSMVNMHGLVTALDMENLEKLIIPATSRSCLYPYGAWKLARKPWAALKTLDVTVDSKLLYTMVRSCDKRTQKATCLDAATTTSLMQFLFVGIQRPALEEVRFKFEDRVEVDIDTVKAVSCLGSCCPNLKKLTLVNWPGTNMSLIKMWGDMQNLEELVLDKCRNIGDLAFVRTDTTDAVHTKLQKLKKLSLLGLDQMPKMTDRLFKEVISQIKLTHLILTSERPMRAVTPDGIRSLEEGAFANSIEKFPFYGWSLTNQGKEDFARMEKKFRAYGMV